MPTISIDTGNGFEEKLSLARDPSPGSPERVVIDFTQGTGAMRSACVNLMEDRCVVEIVEIRVHPMDQEPYRLWGYHSNAVKTRGERHYFLTRAPRIFLSLFKQRVSRIEIAFEVLCTGDEALDRIFRDQADDVEKAVYASQQRGIQERSARLEALGECISRLDGLEKCVRKIEDLQNNIKRVHGVRTLKRHAGQRKTVRSTLGKWLRTGLSAFSAEWEARRIINLSGLFDREFYGRQCGLLGKDYADPVQHYLRWGFKEAIRPHPLFDGAYYLWRYPDVQEAGVNPLVHFLMEGAFQGRSPSPLFDTAFYLKNNPDVAQSQLNPLAHYISSGAGEGRNPGPFFDTRFYAEKNPQVRSLGSNPLAHYVLEGNRQKKSVNREVEDLAFKPVISILTPVYDVAGIYLHQCIRSVVNQVYPHWELCLVDDGSSNAEIRPILEAYEKLDPRIKVRFMPMNRGITSASNAAASMAAGDYLGFVDHDDELAIDALFEIVNAMQAEADTDIVYSDEGVIDANGKVLSYICKPDYAPDLLLGHNYITHLCVVKRSLFDAVGGFRADFEGAQDYDLLLRLVEKARKIRHVPKVLYRWRGIESSSSAHPESKSFADASGRLAVLDALERRGIQGSVALTPRRFYYRIKRNLLSTPLVSIVIPFKDQASLLTDCVHAIVGRTEYRSWEIIGINNGSQEAKTGEAIERLSRDDARIFFYDYPFPFNYSAMMNYAAGICRGEHLLMMNNDVEVLNPDWLEALLEHSQRPEVGAVGAKLYYPDQTIQHAGIVLGIQGFAGHSHRNFPADSDGYYNRLRCIQNVSAVTGALMMVKKRSFVEVGGFDEVNLSVALNDVDFCLKLLTTGRVNIMTPHCEAIHHESASRGYERTSGQKERFDSEIRFFKRKWASFLAKGDPYYNRQLTLEREDFSLNGEARRQFETDNRFRTVTS